jgi:hypothetical protein
MPDVADNNLIVRLVEHRVSGCTNKNPPEEGRGILDFKNHAD